MLKYVSKNFGQFKDFDLNKNFYYCSQGLKRPESKVIYNCNNTFDNVEIISDLKTILKTKKQKFSCNEFFIKVCFNSKADLKAVLSNLKGLKENV